MVSKTAIEWTDATWNPIKGCDKVSPGCKHCYAMRVAARFSGPGQPFEGFAIMGQSGPRWTGKVRLVESRLLEPLKWRKPKHVFVNSMSDLFHEALPDEAIDKVFAVMALTPHITYQVLTKRPERMCEYWSLPERASAIKEAASKVDNYASLCERADFMPLPYRNVWLGVSVENADYRSRIEILRETSAHVRFISIEPLLGDVGELDLTGIHWVIVGGESGTGARPMHPDWARSIRDQCVAASVPFFFKQWGEWAPLEPENYRKLSARRWSHESFAWASDGKPYCPLNPPEGHLPSTMVYRVGKKAAGRLLDWREWNEVPA
jgi:protein gp37